MEEQIIKEAIKTLKEQKRPEKIECLVYGQYDSETKEFIYDDSLRSYVCKEERPENKTVRSVKAFAQIIKE